MPSPSFSYRFILASFRNWRTFMAAKELGVGSDVQNVTLEMLKWKVSEVRDIFAHYYKAMAFYTAITGALFKFATDAGTTADLRVGMATFGLGLSLLGLTTCLMSFRYQTRIHSEITE